MIIDDQACRGIATYPWWNYIQLDDIMYKMYKEKYTTCSKVIKIKIILHKINIGIII
jgi:hypothetical protein